MVIIIDTNIIIDHLRQDPSHLTFHKKLSIKHDHRNMSISTITIQELYIGKSTLTPKEHNKLIKTIQPLKMFSFTPSIAKLAGELMRDSKHNLQFADAAIAATAIHYGASLATLNTKDFKGIPGLKLLKF